MEELIEAYKQIKPFNTTDAVRGFYFLYASKFGKHRWGDKTPDYIRKMKKLQNHIPEARFIHVIESCSTVAIETQMKYGTWANATHR